MTAENRLENKPAKRDERGGTGPYRQRLRLNRLGVVFFFLQHSAGMAQEQATRRTTHTCNVYRIRRCKSHTDTPGAIFQARLLDNQEGANTERCVVSESSRRDCFQR